MRGRKRTDEASSPTSPDREPSPQEAPGAEELSDLLETIEAVANRLYEAHGLPTDPGHYRRGSEEQDWEKVSENLTPAQKFDLILEAPSHAVFQYSAYETLGSRHPHPDVRTASALLAACRGIRRRQATGRRLTPQTLADALRMGATYQRLVQKLEAAAPSPDQVNAPNLGMVHPPQLEPSTSPPVSGD